MSEIKAPKETTGLSFRSQIALFGATLVLIVALPVLILEVRRPWQALDSLIEEAWTMLAGVKSGFEPEELSRMNQFALQIPEAAGSLDQNSLTWSFNLLLRKGELPSEEEMRKALAEAETDTAEFDYAKAQKAMAFWKERFESEPGLLDLFRKYKDRILETKQYSHQAGLDLSDIYVMVDDGKTFAFLIDGFDWTDSTYPGFPYDVNEHGDQYWRGYLTSGPGYYNNPKHYYLNVFPKFDTDEWGTWFTVWLAVESGGVYNAFSVDLDAGHVKRMMWEVGGVIILVSLLLILLISLVTSWLSRRISRPICDLVEGTEAVMRQDYDHVIPNVGAGEFQKLIVVFNDMVKGLKERFNMMQTLEKLLSKELAEQVAKHGLVLGGQRVDITNLFTDFAGFSFITQRMKPEEVVNMLNDYFNQLIPVIKKWGGLPDKYIGDAIVAIFGAPVVLDNHAESAVAAAIEMQLTMRRLNEQRKREGKTILEMRIGLNSGDVIAGAIGSDMKLEYTTIGETTNLANRMESAAEIGHVLMTENTYEKVKHIFFQGVNICIEPQFMKVKGYEQPVATYSVYVADIAIRKNEHPTGPEDYYIVEKADRGLKKSMADIVPPPPAPFTKTIKISPD